MKVVAISRPGPPEVLELRSVPDPECGPREVIVRVHAAGVNRADLLQRRGLYPAPQGAPQQIPGLEFSGEIERIGDRVDRWRPADRVMGIVGGGAYAERLAQHESLCVGIPSGLGWVEAAALPEACIAADDALRQGGLRAGSAVLISAAASGVGTIAVQLALAAGAVPIGLSRSAAKRKRLERLGCARVLDPAHPDAARSVRECTAGRGVDLVLDLVGAAAWPLYFDCLASRGTIVLVGLLGGARAEVDLARILTRRLRVVGSVLRTRSLDDRIAATRAFDERVMPLLARGRLAPIVHGRYPLARAADAHAALERNETFGKLVLEVDAAAS